MIPALTHGTLLDGRIAYTQAADGYRTGIEPVLLAASVPARPGQRVLEAGTGAGAGLLCLAARVAGLRGVGLERDDGQAALAAANFAQGGFAGIEAVVGDVLAWRAGAPFDHAFANPPWHDPAGTPSPDPGRAAAKMAQAGLLEAWACAMAAQLRPRGTLSLILPAACLADAIVALRAAGCAQAAMLPLWPKRGAPAKLIILRGVRGGRGPCTVLPGLVLHEPGGAFSAEADAILRGGAGLSAHGTP